MLMPAIPYHPEPEKKKEEPEKKTSENGAFTSSNSGLFDVEELVKELGVISKSEEKIPYAEEVKEASQPTIPMPKSIPWDPKGAKGITIFEPEDFNIKFTIPVEWPKPQRVRILDAQPVDDPKPTSTLKNSNELAEYLRDRGFVPANCDGKELQSTQGRWNMGILYDLDPTKKRRFLGLLRKKRDFIGYLEFGILGNDRKWKFTAYGNMSAALIADLENRFKVEIKISDREDRPRKERF